MPGGGEAHGVGFRWQPAYSCWAVFRSVFSRCNYTSKRAKKKSKTKHSIIRSPVARTVQGWRCRSPNMSKRVVYWLGDNRWVHVFHNLAPCAHKSFLNVTNPLMCRIVSSRDSLGWNVVVWEWICVIRMCWSQVRCWVVVDECLYVSRYCNVHRSLSARFRAYLRSIALKTGTRWTHPMHAL